MSRRRSRTLSPLAAAAFGVLAAACGSSPAAPQETDQTAALVAMVAEHRAGLGCPELAWHPRLERVAFAHSQDMRRRGYFDHVNPDGETPFDRIRKAGLRWVSAGENLALSEQGAPSVFRAWLNSEEHRRLLDDCSFSHHALARVEGYWTHLYLAPPKP